MKHWYSEFWLQIIVQPKFKVLSPGKTLGLQKSISEGKKRKHSSMSLAGEDVSILWRFAVLPDKLTR